MESSNQLLVTRSVESSFFKSTLIEVTLVESKFTLDWSPALFETISEWARLLVSWQKWLNFREIAIKFHCQPPFLIICHWTSDELLMFQNVGSNHKIHVNLFLACHTFARILDRKVAYERKRNLCVSEETVNRFVCWRYRMNTLQKFCLNPLSLFDVFVHFHQFS